MSNKPASCELVELTIDELDDHPQNPRVIHRQETIDAIAASMGGSFPRQHAIHVREIGDRYQIISGHTRKRAALSRGFKTVWEWVEKDLSDDDAYMVLATSNNQGELSPLEIGLHALHCVGLEKGGRGKTGGMTGYAEKLGKGVTTVRELRSAAEVSEKSTVDRSVLLDKAQHLAAVHALPESCWADAVKYLLKHEFSAADTRDAVQKARAAATELDVPRQWADYIKPDEVVAWVFQGSSAANSARLLDVVEKFRAELEESDKASHLGKEWVGWLVENAGGASWDIRKVQEKRGEFEEKKFDLENSGSKTDRYELIIGDIAKITEKQVESESIDWIITDPPYPQEFLHVYDSLSVFADRVLKPGGSLLAMVGQSYLPEILNRLSGSMSYQWTLAYLTPGGQAVQLWERNVNTFWKPLLWFVKGKYQGDWLGDVCQSKPNDNDKKHHHWGQSESGMADIIERFTSIGDVICDPFLGGGTTGVVAVDMNRRFIGIDIDAAAVETAKGRMAKIDYGDPAASADGLSTPRQAA